MFTMTPKGMFKISMLLANNFAEAEREVVAAQLSEVMKVVNLRLLNLAAEWGSGLEKTMSAMIPLIIDDVTGVDLNSKAIEILKIMMADSGYNLVNCKVVEEEPRKRLVLAYRVM